MVGVPHVAQLKPRPNFFFEFRTHRNPRVAGSALCVADTGASLLRFLECLVDPEDPRLDVVDTQNEQFLGSQSADDEEANDKVLPERFVSRGGQEPTNFFHAVEPAARLPEPIAWHTWHP